MDAACPVEVILILKPSCKDDNDTERRMKITCCPNTCSEFKLLIQEQFKIPACLQKLYFNSLFLSDRQCMRSLYIKTNDVFTVEFTTYANIDELNAITKILVDSIDYLNAWVDALEDPKLQGIFKYFAVESLITRFFYPVDSNTTVANRLYFVHSGGVDLSVKLHRLLSFLQWTGMPIQLQLMEGAILRVLWDFSSTIGVRCLLLHKEGIIDQLSRSVLRQEVQPYCPVIATEAITYSQWYQAENVLKDTMYKGMGVIANLAELPSCQLEIAKHSSMLEQMSAAMLSPSFSIFCSQVVICTFLSLSYSPETHQYLASSQILRQVLDACKPQNYGLSSQVHSYLIVLGHFTTLFFAILATGSTYFIESEAFKELSVDIFTFMQTFLEDHTYFTVREAESKTTYFWSTAKPLVCLAYFNYEQCSNNEDMVLKIHSMSVRAALFSLQNICLSNDGGKILEKEGLMDFLTCLPWYITKEVSASANEILEVLLQRGMRFTPPSLLNIAKARIALSLCIPLDQTMSPEFVDKVRFNLYNN